MISGINGNYTGFSSSVRQDVSKSGNLLASTTNGCKTPMDEMQSASDHLSQKIQVNSVTKTEEILEQKNADHERGISQSDDIASLISMIETSRDIGGEISTDTLIQMLPKEPSSQAQLIIAAADTSDPKKDGLNTALIQNFNKIDTNNDNLVCYGEALNFINQA